MMLAHCDLLIFDCDGVLVDSEQLAFAAFVDVLNRAGVPATTAMVADCFGMKQADVLQKIAQATHMDIPDGVTEALWPATRRAFERDLQPTQGVKAFLDRLDGVKRCVASSSNPERIRLSLELTGLAGYFDEAVFSSHQVARGKPAPDIFLFAARKMGVAPDRCIVIEDSVFGAEGGTAAGMRVIGYVGGSHIPSGHSAGLLAAGAASAEATWSDVAQRIGLSMR
ncbi:HAD family hydrolase [Lichenihabitans sp. PAMC28606]|uniref:HAD family hydrolase n=1 Tax=Lichenihabitans sp. PAMC28606 TaxID=2880932 RepID=UPI001D0A830E|nr:HAD family hydrolase [Lichenihabitans sp. PAMC28606]UDL94477.1 HAD family hydrolase [Lichenihabitans sp. PAMC28606]